MPLTSCVIVGKLSDLSDPPFPAGLEKQCPIISQIFYGKQPRTIQGDRNISNHLFTHASDTALLFINPGPELGPGNVVVKGKSCMNSLRICGCRTAEVPRARIPEILVETEEEGEENCQVL